MQVLRQAGLRLPFLLSRDQTVQKILRALAEHELRTWWCRVLFSMSDQSSLVLWQSK